MSHIKITKKAKVPIILEIIFCMPADIFLNYKIETVDNKSQLMTLFCISLFQMSRKKTMAYEQSLIKVNLETKSLIS